MRTCPSTDPQASTEQAGFIANRMNQAWASLRGSSCTNKVTGCSTLAQDLAGPEGLPCDTAHSLQQYQRPSIVVFCQHATCLWFAW